MPETVLPQYTELLWPTLGALRTIGGSGSIEELNTNVFFIEAFSDAQQQVLHGDGPQTELEYRLAWARTYLKGMGLAHNSKRGVWNLTEAGRNVDEPQIMPTHRDFVIRYREERRNRSADHNDAQPSPDTEDTTDWRDRLLEQIMQVAPDAFERLAQRLLREAGFVSASVTGRSGDGGIDGLGVYRMSLVSFPVFFQCKRYRGTVGSGAVRDFRGAMTGRGDKGLLITTGTFTAEAKAEATRDGAPPIDLIDGQRLCDLLKTYELGVRTEVRQVEDVTVQPEFFDEL